MTCTTSHRRLVVTHDTRSDRVVKGKTDMIMSNNAVILSGSNFRPHFADNVRNRHNQRFRSHLQCQVKA